MQDKKDTIVPPSGGGGAELAVCLTPSLISLFDVEDHIVVVI